MVAETSPSYVLRTQFCTYDPQKVVHASPNSCLGTLFPILGEEQKHIGGRLPRTPQLEIQKSSVYVQKMAHFRTCEGRVHFVAEIPFKNSRIRSTQSLKRFKRKISNLIKLIFFTNLCKKKRFCVSVAKPCSLSPRRLERGQSHHYTKRNQSTTKGKSILQTFREGRFE